MEQYFTTLYVTAFQNGPHLGNISSLKKHCLCLRW